MLGLPEEEEWSFVLPLPWGEGSEIKGQGATAPGRQKSHKLAWGGGCSNTVRKKLAIRPREEAED